MGLGSGFKIDAALLAAFGQRVGEQARGTAALAEYEHALAVEVAGGRSLGSGRCRSGGGVGLHGLGSSAGGNALLASALPWKASLSLAAFSAFLAASSSWEISASSVHFWAS